ncbi:MAG: hypothetical protein KF757_07225 [Phycisphaeraceae bacterium]|nr:hypothetical protein [Phycisphaeraceae bacterium]
MRRATIATVTLSVLVLGGCNAHRQSHLQFPTVQDRDWWMLTASSDHTVNLAAADPIGTSVYQNEGYSGRSMLAVGDSLGSVSFSDTFAYAEAARQHRQDQLATFPIAD